MIELAIKADYLSSLLGDHRNLKETDNSQGREGRGSLRGLSHVMKLKAQAKKESTSSQRVP